MNPKSSTMILPMCLLLSFSISPTTTHAERLSVGGVERVQKLAQAVHKQYTRRLTKHATVHALDLLKTGKAARLNVQLEDGSDIVMGENAELMVDEFIYTPEKERTIGLNALQGALLFVGKKMNSDARQDVRVKTPVALLGVRGTHFWTGPIDGDTGVLVLDGEVLVSSKYGLVSLRPGEGTMIRSNGVLSAPKKWGEQKKARALKMIEFQ